MKRLTAARRAGLLTVAAGEDRQVEVRRSNVTTGPDAPVLAVYWQTADWLTAEGLAVDELGPVRDGLRLTNTGRELVARLDVGERP